MDFFEKEQGKTVVQIFVSGGSALGNFITQSSASPEFFCWQASFDSLFSGQLDLSLIGGSTRFAVPQEKKQTHKKVTYIGHHENTPFP